MYTENFYEWNLYGFIPLQVEQMFQRMYIVYKSYLTAGKYPIVACKIIFLGFLGAL